MYTVLAKEVADVDHILFEQVGNFAHNVKAIPVTDQIFAVKGIRSNKNDTELDCQNSFFVTVDAEAVLHLHNDNQWMVPGALYERDGKRFAELRYEHPLGLINLVVYFLVPIEDCEFYSQGDCDDDYCLVTFEKLQESGRFQWAAR